MDLTPIFISIKVALTALGIVLVIGVILAKIFTEKEFPLKTQLESLIILPMVLPPTILGYGLLMLFGRRGPLGSLLYNTFGVSVVFTWVAAVLASSIVALPLMYQSVKAAFKEVDSKYIQAARTLGLSECKIFWKIKLPLAKNGILSGVILAFARAFGEFGATLMLAGNIPGKTQTLPMAIYFAVEAGNYRTANYFLVMMIAISLGLVYLLNRKAMKRG